MKKIYILCVCMALLPSGFVQAQKLKTARQVAKALVENAGTESVSAVSAVLLEGSGRGMYAAGGKWLLSKPFVLPSDELNVRLHVLANAQKRPFRSSVSFPVIRTGMETFTALRPDWKNRLRPSFSPEALAAVEDALKEADEIIFKQEATASGAELEKEWNYEECFLRQLYRILNERRITLSSFQVKTLIGGKGSFDNMFPSVLRLVSLEGWLQTHQYAYPVQSFFRNGRHLKAEELSEEEHSQRLLAKKIDYAVISGDLEDPVIARMAQLRALLRINAPIKTPEEWLAELEEWVALHPGTYPGKSVSRGGVRISPQDLSPQAYMEYQLATGLDGVLMRGDPEDPVVKRILELKDAGRKYAKRKTASEWLVELENWLASHENVFPKANFYKDGKLIKSSELTPEQLEEKRLGDGVSHFILKGDAQDEAVKRLRELKSRYGVKRGASR